MVAPFTVRLLLEAGLDAFGQGSSARLLVLRDRILDRPVQIGLLQEALGQRLTHHILDALLELGRE